MNKTILLVTLATLFVAGCTQANIPTIFQQNTNTIVGGTGMVISDFSADQTEIYGGQTDRIIMTASNKGGHSVPQTESLIYLTGSALNLTGDNKIYWTGTGPLIQSFGKEMKPADPVRDTPADEKTASWSLTAPNVSRGEQTTYLFIGRIYYDYQSKVTGNIWVYSETEADAAKASKRTLNKATWSATSGPVAVNARLTQDPVILYGTEDKFTLIIKVSNAGSGVLYEKGAISNYGTTNPNDLNLTSTQINRVTIGGNVAGTALPTDCTGTQELIGGKDITLTCDVTIIAPATFQGFPITITADYGYYTERTTSVTVSGR